jgi:predicted nucleic acid-binding protein
VTLVDTSVWIEHFKQGGLPKLSALVEAHELLVHPAVIGEVGLGNLGARREQILGALRSQQLAPVLADVAAMELVEAHRLWGSGLGWIDIHLLASARVGKLKLWTLDKRLAAVAKTLGVAG